MSYELQARKFIVKLMNSGMGFVSAIKAVQSNATHFSVNFLHLFFTQALQHSLRSINPI